MSGHDTYHSANLDPDWIIGSGVHARFRALPGAKFIWLF